MLSGRVSNVRYSGGYQGDSEHVGSHATQWPTREPVRAMYPAEFLSILRRHKHPRWPDIGIVSRASVNIMRREAGFRNQGTLYVANATERRWLFSVPTDCLPYTTIKTATWSEERTKWERGELVRGWRPALVSLLSSTYLLPSNELSYLIGQDTFKSSPIEYRR